MAEKNKPNKMAEVAALFGKKLGVCLTEVQVKVAKHIENT